VSKAVLSIRRSSESGSVLLEVVVATVLIGLLVVPLATALAGTLDEARRARERAVADMGAAGDWSTDGAWEWGPRVIAGWWKPGPVLHLRLAVGNGSSDAGRHVGFWADGSLVAEQAVLGGGDASEEAGPELQMGPEAWNGLTEKELVVRVRDGEGAWGPPCRLAVPVPGAGPPAVGSVLGYESPDLTAVVHRPGVGTSSLTASWSAASLASPSFGLLFPFSAAVEGWGGVSLDGRTQWWRMDGGRSVDVYF
jgi:hypothetical protein